MEAVEGEDYVRVRRLLRDDKVHPDVPLMGAAALPVAVERGDIGCVAMLLHYNASPDLKAASGAPTACELALRMRNGEHADVTTRAGRRGQIGQREAGERILRLLNEPQGGECQALLTAFGKLTDQREAEQQQQREVAMHGGVLLLFVLLVLWALGAFAGLTTSLRRVTLDQKEL